MDNNNLYSIMKFFIILLFVPTICFADEWVKEDISLATIFTLSTVIDWGQTRDIVKNSDYGYYEKTNVYLGKNPSLSKVDTYMPLAIISSLTIAHFLPKDWRKKFLYGISFLELGTIYNNHKIGLKVNF